MSAVFFLVPRNRMKKRADAGQWLGGGEGVKEAENDYSADRRKYIFSGSWADSKEMQLGSCLIYHL